MRLSTILYTERKYNCSIESVVYRLKNGVKSCMICPEEVVQVYGFCIRTLRLPVISVMIIRVMRFSYNQTADFGTICSKLNSCERPILQGVCILGGQGSTQFSRPLLLLPLVCESAVKAGSTFKPLKLVRFKHP